jgi:histidinol-phosphate aminotransferase
MPQPELDTNHVPSVEAQAGGRVTPIDALAGVQRIPEGGRERAGYVPLDRNERLSPLPEWSVELLRAGVESELLTGYPMLEELYEDLVRTFEVRREQLLLTAGSDAAFRALHHAYARPGDRTVMLAPSYAMYPIYSRMFGAEPIQVPFEVDLSLDVEALLAAITPDVRMVLLANPNQPTGTKLSHDDLRAVVDRAGRVGALVAIDEAYFPFSHSTVLPWLANNPHLVVTRTFSKAWGLAGARIGLAAADPDVIANLYKVRSAYDVNAFAALCARTLLAHPQIASDYVAEVDAGRDVICRRAREMGLDPLPGETNFQLIRVGDRIEPAVLVERLRERRYLIKGPFGAPCLRDCVRVTLGPPQLMAEFCDALQSVLDGG